MTYEQKCQRWRAIFDKCAASGLSQAEFCRREKISKSTFYTWTKKLPVTPPKPAIVPVRVTEPPHQPHIDQQLTLTLPNGCQLAFPATLAPTTLQQLIKAITP